MHDGGTGTAASYRDNFGLLVTTSLSFFSITQEGPTLSSMCGIVKIQCCLPPTTAENGPTMINGN